MHILLVGGHEESFHMLDGLGDRFTIFQNETGVTDFQRAFASHIRIFDYTNLALVTEKATEIHNIDPFDGVLSFTEYGLLPAAIVKELLGIYGNDAGAVKLTRDKIAMRKALVGTAVGTTRFRECASFEEAAQFFAELGRSIILKPSHGAGSSGVFSVESLSSLEQAWKNSRSEHEGPTLLEEFVDGKEFSVEVFTHLGQHTILAVTEKCTTGAPRFIEMSHLMPARLSSDELTLLHSMVVTFLDVIGQSFGPAHVEVKQSTSGFKIIECNTRPGGDFIWQLVRETTGFDMIRESVKQLGGRTSVPSVPKARAGRVRFFCLEHVEVRAVSGVELARASEGVIRLNIEDIQVGRVFGELRSSDDRQGVIVVTGNSTEQAEERCQAALQEVVLDLLHSP